MFEMRDYLPDCPYCGQEIDGPSEDFGGERLHRHCKEAVGREMAEAWDEQYQEDILSAIDDGFLPVIG